MNITSDFESGNGKNIQEIAPGQFRMEEVGEEPPYCKYFCVRVESGGDGGRVRLDVYPDPQLGERGRVGMMGHYPSPIWFSKDDMESWKPVEHVLDRTLRFHETHLTVEVRLEPESTIHVASNPVVTYARMLSWAGSLNERARGPCECLSLGDSFEGREIPVLHLPSTGSDPIPVFLLAGQHPSEHCGDLAMMGAAEFLVSHHPEAVELRRRCAFWICPMINVDGNAHGRNGWTMEDVNMYGDFAGASEGTSPGAAEDRLLWNWLTSEARPEVTLHVHGYMGRRGFVDPPYDGLYTFPDPAVVYRSPDRAEIYAALRDRLIWDTDGLTGHGRPASLSEETLEFHLARSLGTIPAFYEINHGYHGVWGAKRKGARILRTVLEGFLTTQ